MEKRHIALLLLLILAIVTRFYGISFQSLWIDEGSTYYFSHFTWDQLMAANDPNPPFYYMMESVALDILGRSEFGIRFTSAVAGVAVVIVSFFLAEKIHDDWKFATLVSSMFILSVISIEYSQEARGYELVLLIFLVQIYVLLNALEHRATKWWIVLGVLSALSFFMHYTGILGSITLYLYALYHYRVEIKNKDYSNIKMILISGIIFFIIISPLLKSVVDSTIIHHINREWVDFLYHGFDYMADTLLKFCNGSLLMLVFAIIGGYYCYKEHRDIFPLMMMIIFIPLSVATLLSFRWGLFPKYILWSLPAYLFLIAMCIYSWFTNSRRKTFMKYVGVAAIACIILISGLSMNNYYTTVTKADYRGAGEVLNEYCEEDDIFVWNGSEEIQYATISFYFDPDEHGVEKVKYQSFQQIIDLSHDPTYEKVIVMVHYNNELYEKLTHQDPEKCKEIFSGGFDFHIFVITSPL